MRFKDEYYRKEKSNPHARLDCFSLLIKRVLGSVVAIVFQITFGAEMHTNNIFLFFKKKNLTPAHQNDPKHTNHIKFFKNMVCTAFPNMF
jgi:hypothetical protein